MPEAFPSTHESSSEREPTRAEVERQIDHAEKMVQPTRDLLIEVVQLLEETIPENDVADEVAKVSYNVRVLRNLGCARLDELDRIEQDLKTARAELSAAA